jgi:hypothetical protein
MEITANTFITTFEEAVTSQLPELLDGWHNQKLFTAYFTNRLAPRIAELLDYYARTEHKRIYIVLTPLTELLQASFADQDIAVAIEHDNNYGKSHEEIIKLRKLDAPLGVLITYASPQERRPKLEDFLQHISIIDSQIEGVAKGELLVIIGTYGMKRPTNLSWPAVRLYIAESAASE